MVIVVAGMEGALPSVVAGLVDAPVIAVPTSVGYGASFQGLAALLAMLNSCASGVGVVNIDNGFGAAPGLPDPARKTPRRCQTYVIGPSASLTKALILLILYSVLSRRVPPCDAQEGLGCARLRP